VCAQKQVYIKGLFTRMPAYAKKEETTPGYTILNRMKLKPDA